MIMGRLSLGGFMELSGINAGTSYSVECGQSYAQLYLADLLKPRLEKAQVAIITDREVSGYYINDFVQQFMRNGINPTVIVIDGSQAAKSFDVVRSAFERLTDIEFAKKDLLIALGGGGVIDVAAFVAATYQKGIDYIQVPTSLLAMIDSSVAGDSFLNFQSHKNQIGVASSPARVLIDTDYLRTLPPRFQANGIAQAILFGLLGNGLLLELLQEPNIDMMNLVDQSIKSRKLLREKDPRFLSFGQEIAEAIEGHFRFLKYTHGEALALGMLSLYHSDRMKAMYIKFGLPMTVTGVAKDTLLKRILKNYENHDNPVNIVRLDGEGHPFIDKIPSADAASFFDKVLSGICT